VTPYLASSQYIDWHDRGVAKKAAELAEGCSFEEIISKKCFEFVRDSIKHSWDFKISPVTCRASDVLRHGTGYCYAKSHLLAALLRANGIPAGLCYQRLALGAEGAPFCLHGLNAVYLQRYGWYRIDPRGNKAGVDAAFTPPIERLAFPNRTKGEILLPEIWPEPMPVVVAVLTRCTTVEQVAGNLPDVEIIESPSAQEKDVG
jgi:transglutaminase-like putative cysteine protease